MTARDTQNKPRRVRFTALGVVVLSTLFIAGPTPGDIGGCGGDGKTDVLGDPGQAQYDYFDQGFCAHFCWRLRECGALCSALPNNGGPGCTNESPEAFVQCVRGDIRADLFMVSRCPHTCGPYRRADGSPSQFVGAIQRDITSCGHDVLATACDVPTLRQAIANPPASCIGVCQ